MSLPPRTIEWIEAVKNRTCKTGLTLLEILIVVIVTVILVAMVIGIAARIDTQGKERLAKNTIALLNAALGQFGNYGYNYSDPCLADFKFPLDCNSFLQSELEDALKDELGAGSVLISGGYHDPNYSGSEALYLFLSKVPESRETLDKINKSLITGKDNNKLDMTITIDSKNYPLLRFIDPWGETLRYDYYDEKPPPLTSNDIDDMKKSKKTFPVITSAGPDKEFGTADDIAGR